MPNLVISRMRTLQCLFFSETDRKRHFRGWKFQNFDLRAKSHKIWVIFSKGKKSVPQKFRRNEVSQKRDIFDHRGYWIRNTDKNNIGLSGARLKACLSKISSTKKCLCMVITLFSFEAILSIFVKFC